MTCEQVNDELSAYLDGELPADARAAVESHLAGCTECKQAAEELKSIAAAIHDLPRHKAPASLVAVVHERVQKSPAPLLLIDTASPINASGEVLKPRSMWGPVAFGIAAVLMLFALAFAVMPAISNNGDSTAMREERRKEYKSAPADRGEVASAEVPAETARTAAAPEFSEKRADFKADRDATFNAVPAPQAENKPNALTEGGAARDKGRVDIGDAKPELLDKAAEAPARKATLGSELRKRDAPAAAVTPAATQGGANANGVPAIPAERSAKMLNLQQEKQATRAADAVPQEDATGSKKQADFGQRSGGGRRLSAKDPEAPQAPGAPPQAPGNAAPAPVVVPSAPPAPAPKPTTPAPFAAAPKAEKTDALTKAAPQEPTAGQDKAAGDIKKKSVATLETGEEFAAEKNKLKEGVDLRRNVEDPAANRNARQQEQEQSGKGAARGAAQPTDGALAGGKPGAGSPQAPPPPAKRALPADGAEFENDNKSRKDGRNAERLKSMKDEADRTGGIGGGGGEGAGLARNGIKPALTFRTRDPQSLRAQMANLALQHGGTLVSQGAGTSDLVAHIPAPQRDAFIKKLSELQAQPIPEAAKTTAAAEAKREAASVAEPAQPFAKQKADEKADTAEVTFRVVIESIVPAAAPVDAGKQPNE